MTAPQTTEAPASSATELEASLGELFGDYSTSGESPDPDPTSAAGTTPAEPAPETDPSADPAAVVAPSDESAGTTPETPAADPDVFAGSEPLSFTVNGRTVTNDGIRVFKEGGAVIKPEALSDLQNKLGERETLFERNRAQSAEYQTLAKVTEWTDPSSNKTYTGPEAAIEMRIGNAALLAENQLLVNALMDPASLRELLTTEQVPDGRGGLVEQIIVNPATLARLQRENTLTQRELAAKIRDHYQGVMAQASQPAPVPVDFSAATPALITDIATAAKLDATVLTPSDRALLAKQLPFHTKDGKVSVDWQELVTERIQLRAEQKAQSQSLVKTTSDATKTGLANMAAAARGLKPGTPKPVATPQRPVAPTTERAAVEGDLYDAMERASAAAIRRSA